jgi:hypothetical protein
MCSLWLWAINRCLLRILPRCHKLCRFRTWGLWMLYSHFIASLLWFCVYVYRRFSHLSHLSSVNSRNQRRKSHIRYKCVHSGQHNPRGRKEWFVILDWCSCCHSSCARIYIWCEIFYVGYESWLKIGEIGDWIYDRRIRRITISWQWNVSIAFKALMSGTYIACDILVVCVTGTCWWLIIKGYTLFISITC